MLPAQRGQVSQQMVGNVLRLTQRGDGALEVSRVPKDDRGDEEVEAGSSVLLVFVSAIADFAEPVDEDCPRQAVGGELKVCYFLYGTLDGP